MKKILLTMMAAGLISTGFAATQSVDFNTPGLHVEADNGNDIQLKELKTIASTFTIDNPEADSWHDVMSFCIVDNTDGVQNSIILNVDTAEHIDFEGERKLALKESDGTIHGAMLMIAGQEMYVPTDTLITETMGDGAIKFVSDCSNHDITKNVITARVFGGTLAKADDNTLTLTVVLTEAVDNHVYYDNGWFDDVGPSVPSDSGS